MNIGYACLGIAIPGSKMKSTILKNAITERLLSLIEHNLNALESMIDYNIENGVKLFRISSDLIPFGSSVAAELPWDTIFAEKLSTIGNKIIQADMRVSMHPGQYTVLNSPDELVAMRAAQDLEYHTKLLNSLGVDKSHKIILHVGGVYGDIDQASSRFITRYQQLPQTVKDRLVLENDDKLFNIRQVLDIAHRIKTPVVYDNLHNAVNLADDTLSDLEWIKLCSYTWQKDDGCQKIHYSQQDPDKKPGAHSGTIAIDPFLDFYHRLEGVEIDIMLEVKDKNISALKCLNCISNRGIARLETEWGRYKYVVLEHSPEHYLAIRQLLQDKTIYPGRQMYQLIEQAMANEVVSGQAVNAAQHVWGYFKNRSSESEKKRFSKLLAGYTAGETGLQPIKNMLLKLSLKHQEDYLLEGYYLYL